MDVWVVLGFTHRMWACPTKAVNSSHGALSEQWTKQNPSNILKMIHLCDTASLFDRAFQSGYGQVKQESPHRCARWVKSKLHSQPRPAATNVTTLQTLPLPSHRRRDNFGTLQSACRPSSFCLLLLSTIVLLACSKWSESKLKTIQMHAVFGWQLLFAFHADFCVERLCSAHRDVTSLKKSHTKTFTSWNV